MTRLLIVDDESSLLDLIQRSLEGEGYEILRASSGAEAVAYLWNRDFEVILTDQNMPAMRGVELLRNARRLRPFAARLLMTGEAPGDVLAACADSDLVHGMLFKPWSHGQLQAALRQAVAHNAAAQQRARRSQGAVVERVSGRVVGKIR